MKVGLCISSDFAIQRLKGELQYELTQYSDVKAFQEAIQYQKPDIVVLDYAYPNFKEIEILLTRFFITIIYFDGDFEDVIEQIKGQEIFFGNEEEQVHDKYIPDHQKFIDALNKEVPEEKGPEIIYKEKIVEKEIEKLLYTSAPSKLIVVGSLYSGAGSTVLATNMARMIAKRGINVAYIEHPYIKPYMFDYMQIHANEDVEYVDLAREIAEEGYTSSKNASYREHDISWHVIDSRKTSLDFFSDKSLLALTHSINSTIQIVDISTYWLKPEIQKFLHMADAIYICVEPDPIKNDWSLFQSTDGQLTTEKKIMDYLINNHNDVFQYVMMKSVNGIDMKLVRETLYKKPIASIPYIEYQVLKKALFKSKLVFDVEGYELHFEKNLIQALNQFIPKEVIRNTEKKKPIFGGFFK